MADDYIKQQTAIDAICTDWCGTSNADCKNPFNPEKDEYYHCDGCGDVELIKALPSAQLEIIHCKDCVHYMPYDWMFSEVRQSQNIEDYPQDEIGCEWIDHHVKPDGFCSMGERKDD